MYDKYVELPLKVPGRKRQQLPKVHPGAAYVVPAGAAGDNCAQALGPLFLNKSSTKYSKTLTDRFFRGNFAKLLKQALSAGRHPYLCNRPPSCLLP